MLVFHHIAVATASIPLTLEAYKTLGYQKKGEVVLDEIQGVAICFIDAPNAPLVELVEPLSEKSPVSNLLKKAGGTTPYHFCYRCTDITSAIDELENAGYRLISAISPAAAMNLKQICFLYHQNGGLIELVEE